MNNPSWPLWRHPHADPPEIKQEDPWGAKASDWVLVKTQHGRMYTAQLVDWQIDEDDDPYICWKMAGRDAYTIDDVIGWMPLPPEEPAPLPKIERGMIVLNVNRQVIDRNTKHQTNAPPIRIQKGKGGKPTYAHAAAILDANGQEAGRLIYNAQGSLVACGARLVLVAHYGAVPVSESVDSPTDAG
ncbi:hypothetical protein HOT99_gp237 [Caulobacter phage CcrBL10]|uniref:Uncharacterized protein n=1 Tax=Caulobacter phage CcrBL10 TaxID=2283269 RepID=A0A385E9M4_9CAUD|nr:hypothetical protein HOT99_gp237 [Caulobacter phage CcrBL10]AXQ68380.1 hypothetical protein CcrBL10_gp176c [Caulobacter phage CcrBL10]